MGKKGRSGKTKDSGRVCGRLQRSQGLHSEIGFAPAHHFWLAHLLLLNFVLLLARSADSAPPADPWKRIAALVERSIARGDLPGCVIVVTLRDRILFEAALGNARVEPATEPMRADTLFDLASLTKPIATATSVMVLMQDGELRIRDPVAKYLPEFATKEKEMITLEQLLTHQAGFVPDSPLTDYLQPQEIWPRLLALPLEYEPGTRFVYSDVGFQLLGRVVETVSGKSLDAFARERIFVPLKMTDTGFVPSEDLRRRAAPMDRRPVITADTAMKLGTESQGIGDPIQGEVHDPRAFAMGGIAGHAGLFSTAADLTRYARMMLNRGALEGVRVLHPQTIEIMTEPRRVGENHQRGLGWDVKSTYSINRGDLLGPRSFGHGGFTGTGIWIDPDHGMAVIFLSNRLHPDGVGLVNPLIGAIGSIAVQALEPSETQDVSGKRADGTPRMGKDSEYAAIGSTLTGIDVLIARGFEPLRDQRIGLITNHTGRDRQGRLTRQLLADAPGLALTAIFSPEHGIAGNHDDPRIDDGKDPSTGVPVYSLYGPRNAPTAEMLQDIDTLVFDIQDIGTRFYTYMSTMGLAMEAAAKHHKRFVVLDRPNPLGGTVEGPMRDPEEESFVAYHRVPVRHGLTAGELARLFRHERGWELDLEVIPLEGWRRGMWWEDTGLPWVNPSPNMRSIRQAALYSGIGLLETTNLCVGRGTDSPFEVIAAPWLDGVKLAADLRAREIPGVRFVPREVIPTSSKFVGERCGGLEIVVTDRAALASVRVGCEIALALRRLYPTQWDVEHLNRLLVHHGVLTAILEQGTWEEIDRMASAELESYRARTKEFLLYEE